jgi:exodeoxyribonuclease VII small subunit
LTLFRPDSEKFSQTGDNPMPRKKNTLDFEQALSELEAIVERMEQGELSLDASLQAYEDGVKYVRECQSFLDQAEQKIQLISQQPDGQIVGEPLVSAPEAG